MINNIQGNSTITQAYLSQYTTTGGCNCRLPYSNGNDMLSLLGGGNGCFNNQQDSLSNLTQAVGQLVNLVQELLSAVMGGANGVNAANGAAANGTAAADGATGAATTQALSSKTEAAEGKAEGQSVFDKIGGFLDGITKVIKKGKKLFSSVAGIFTGGFSKVFSLVSGLFGKK